MQMILKSNSTNSAVRETEQGIDGQKLTGPEVVLYFVVDSFFV